MSLALQNETEIATWWADFTKAVSKHYAQVMERDILHTFYAGLQIFGFFNPRTLGAEETLKVAQLRAEK